MFRKMSVDDDHLSSTKKLILVVYRTAFRNGLQNFGGMSYSYRWK